MNPAVGSDLTQFQIRLRPVRVALTLLRVTTIPVGQSVPRDVRQIAVFVNENPGRLLQPAAALDAFSGFRGSAGAPCFGVPAATAFRPLPSPGRPVQQAARQAAHPCRESQRRDPSDHRPVTLCRARRRAQHFTDAERAPHPIHVADLPLQRIAALAVPGADVLYHHQAVRAAHDGAHRAVAQQVRESNRNVFVSHGT